MNAYKAKNKDRFIKFFAKDEREIENGTIKTYKVYLHGPNTLFKAYIRSLKSGEDASDDAERSTENIEVICNYHPFISLSTIQDKYIEFNKNYYQIVSVDNLEYKNSEMKLEGRKVDLTFDGVEYSE